MKKTQRCEENNELHHFAQLKNFSENSEPSPSRKLGGKHFPTAQHEQKISG